MRRGCIGVVREAYSKWERRCPFTPSNVAELVQQHGVRVLVQPCNKRVFANAEYEAAGAELRDDLGDASVIFGVKQVPVQDLLAERTYVFFSHVIKAQPENMELLDAVLDKRVRLIDYECINARGQRSVRDYLRCQSGRPTHDVTIGAPVRRHRGWWRSANMLAGRA
eukprot:SAG11_NODE_153_length_14352_cov_24.348323_15_plen_167_part_00